MTEALTVADAWAEFRKVNHLPEGYQAAIHWTVRLGPLTLRLPNFAWRRRAVVAHDLHHVLTGIPCTFAGECQVAAWEFAAGPYRHPAPTLFCLPLVSLGFLFWPRRVWRAFVQGSRSRSLHHQPIDRALLGLKLGELERLLEKPEPHRLISLVDFAGLVAASAGVNALPISVGSLFFL